MQSSNYKCRKATANDDVKLIAKYIHLTDEYIYPCICKNPLDENWIKFIAQCLQTEDNIFNLNHISIILHNEDIIGIACVIPCGKELNFPEKSELFGTGFDVALKGYFQPLIAESIEFNGYNITNVCVDENYRGKGLGSLIMSHCIAEYPSAPIHLDVIASNESAIRLYKKFGFEITDKYLGFSGDEAILPCYHMLFTPNN